MKATVKKLDVQFFGNPLGSYKDKFNRVAKLALKYDSLIEKLDSFIAVNGISHRCTCAMMCKIMLTTGIRIGNEASAEGYMSKRKDAGFQQTYGLTTLEWKHVSVKGARITLKFNGKRSVAQTLYIKDAVVAEKIKNLPRLDGKVFPVSDYELRKFIRTYIGSGFKAKDLRTFHANVAAYNYFVRELKKVTVTTKKDLNTKLRELIAFTAERLGNTPAIAKKAYIDVRLLEFVTLKIKK